MPPCRGPGAHAPGRARVPLGGVPRALFVPAEDVAQLIAVFPHRVIERHDRATGDAEHHLDALGLERAKDRIGSVHSHLLSFGLTVLRPFSGRREGDPVLSPPPSALLAAGCVSDISLAGENVNELDAYAARCREARIAIGHGYGEAEHRLRSMPEHVGGRKPEVSLLPRGETRSVGCGGAAGGSSFRRRLRFEILPFWESACISGNSPAAEGAS